MRNRIAVIFLALVLLLSLSACASQAPKVFEVRFELNGGTLVAGQLLQRIEAGGAAEAPEVEREGFVFEGWSEPLDAVSANTVAVAQWSPAEAAPAVYEVRFELNGGTLIAGHLLQQVEEGGAAEAPEVEREGYAFVGWSEPLEPVTGNTIAAAMWECYYPVHFDPAGGRVVSGESEQLVRKGETPAPPEVERDFFSFVGWSPSVGAVQGESSYAAQWKARKLSSEEIYDKISPAVVEISAYEPSGQYYSLGSGFFIDDAGRLVTNYHVIEGTNAGEVMLADGSRRDILAVLGYDKALDLAVLQIDIADNPFLSVSARAVTTGEAIYALGSSQGLTSTFSSGIVSTASREIDGINCIQTTAPISEGNSGGPLVDSYGEVVGVNSMTLVTGQNLNFAIDIHELDKLPLDKALSLADVYALEYPEGESGVRPEDVGFYSDTDLAEQESNDIFLLSDSLENGSWIAGEIGSADDMDFFYLNLDAPGEVSFEVIPYYTDDTQYLLCGILSLTDDDDVELMDALSPSNVDGYEAMVGTIRFDTAGTYFLLLCVDENYPYDDPAYYAVRASW